MTIEKRIESDFLKAFKERNTVEKSLLSTVKGEMQTAKKNLVVDNLSDEESIKILSKFAKNLKETLRTLAPIDGMAESIRKTSNELVIIESYLPKQMSEADINEKLDELISGGVTDIGSIMKAFATISVDKKLVSELAKSKI
jgi:uncharacterized protein YqeY